MRKLIGRGLIAVALTGSGIAMASGTSFASGQVQAFGIQVRGVVNVGPLPLANAARSSETLASVNVASVSSGTLNASVSQTATSEKASASVQRLSVGLGPIGLSAGAVSATCTAQSGKNTRGSASLANVQVPGLTIPVNAAPNTTLSLPLGLGSVTLNAQQPASPGSGALTVAAIKVQLAGQTIIVAQATCGPAGTIRHHRIPGKTTVDEPVNGSTVVVDRPLISGTGTPGQALHVVNAHGQTVCTTTVGTDGIWYCTPDMALPHGWNTFYVKNSSGQTLTSFRIYIAHGSFATGYGGMARQVAGHHPAR